MYVSYRSFIDRNPPKNYFRTKDEIVREYGSIENWCMVNINNALVYYMADDYYDIFVESGQSKEPQRKIVKRIDAMIENIKYYYGMQDNTPILPTVDSMVPFTRNKKIKQIIDRTITFINSFVYGMEVYSKSLSYETVTAKEKAIALFKARKAFAPLFEAIAKETGYDVAIPQEVMEGLQEAEDFVLQNIKTNHEIIGDKIIRYFKELYSLKDIFSAASIDALIERISGILISDINGNISILNIPGHLLLFDPNAREPFNRRFAGMVRYLTPDEIIQEYEINPSVITDITNNSNFEKWGISFNGFKWFANDGRIPVVTLFWKTLLMPDFDEDETLAIMAASGFLAEMPKLDYVYRADCVAGRVIVHHGHTRNTIRDLNGRAMLPISEMRFCTSGNVLSSPIDTIKNIADKLDALDYQITTKYARDMGRVYVFVGHVFKNVDLEALQRDFREIGYTVIPVPPDVAPGDIPKDAITLDFSADPNLERYIILRDKYKQEMEEALSLSELTLGTSSKYVSNMHIGLASEISKGSVNVFMNNVSKAVLYVYHYLINMIRQSAVFDDEKMMPIITRILNEEEIIYLKDEFYSIGEMITTYAKLSDMIDAQAKDSLVQIALAFAQRPDKMIPDDVIFKMLSVRTYSELTRLLNEGIKRGQLMMQMQQQMELERQLALKSQGMPQGQAQSDAMPPSQTDMQQNVSPVEPQ